MPAGLAPSLGGGCSVHTADALACSLGELACTLLTTLCTPLADSGANVLAVPLLLVHETDMLTSAEGVRQDCC